MSKSTITDEEVFVLMLVGAGILLAAPWTLTLEPVRAWAIDAGVLVSGDDVLLPLWEGSGLDIWRVAIAAGIGLAAIALVAAGIRAKQKSARRV